MSRSSRPPNNRVDGSKALATSTIWSKVIGHDPHAPSAAEPAPPQSEQVTSMLLIAKLNAGSDATRGGCKRCGQHGHLTFQCRNPIAAAATSREVADSESSTSTSSSSASSSSSSSASPSFQAQVVAAAEPTQNKKRSREDSDDGEKREEKKRKKEKKERKKEKKKEKKVRRREKKDKRKKSKKHR